MQTFPPEFWWAFGIGTVLLIAISIGIVLIIALGHQRALKSRLSQLEELSKSEKKYKDLFDNSLVGIFRLDISEKTLLDANRAMLRMFGCKNISELNTIILGDNAPKWSTLWSKLEKFHAIESYELESTTKDASTIFITCSAYSIGSDSIIEGVLTDITEQRNAQSKILDQAELLDKTSDAIIDMDLDANILYWNKGAQVLYGWNADEVTGQSLSQLLFPNEERDEFAKGLEVILTRGEWRREMMIMTRSGGEQHADCRLTLVRDNTGLPKSILCVNTDITERKLMEAQMLRAQRLESIGTLAGGIAHDLNNILAPIVVSIDILKRTIGDALATKTLAAIESSAKRGTDMVKQVLTFARGIQGERLTMQIDHVLFEVLRLIEETFPRGISINNEIPKQLWPIIGDATQLHQVFMNLCVNARDAMPAGGTLTLHAENTVVDEALAGKHYGASAGPHIHLWVGDTGTGMPDNIKDKIFEPFFTTKSIGKGTGLGLSTSLGIVKSHDGFLTLESQEGKGTVFHIYLPAVVEDVLEEEEAPQEELRQAKGELVLVVDDESVLREVATSTLESWGYEVVEASDGEEALEIFESRRDEIKVVITDMMMPNKDGAATIRAMRSLEPNVKIIIMTGMRIPDDIRVEDIQSVEGVLQKPYTAEKLLSTLQGVMEM
jgi:PAS domain S-box-containing protein